MAAYKIAQISIEQAQLIQKLEKKLDVCMLAMEPGLEMAQLSDEDLSRVKELEKELGVNLIVYKEC
jgi:hypothetical protein